MRISGPAIIVEDETSTVVPASFAMGVNALGYLVLDRIAAQYREHQG
jgi:hypothetical protein